MRKLLLTLALAILTAGCTNDYGQFRFPPGSDGGAVGSEGGTTTGGTTIGGTGGTSATGGTAGAN